MELKSFVSQTLQDIVDGVKDAQEKVGAGVIVSKTNTTEAFVKHGVTRMQSVKFDVTVSVEQGGEAGGKIGVLASFVNFGVEGKQIAKNEQGFPSRFPPYFLSASSFVMRLI